MTVGVVEMAWYRAESSPGTYDASYLENVYSQVRLLHALGFQVSLNAGMQDAPSWFLNQPGARYVDQFGEVYTNDPLPNLVFGTQYRPAAVDYLTTVFRYLGTNFKIVRVGGGHASPHGEAATFLNWYLDSLVNYQNWQIAALRQARSTP